MKKIIIITLLFLSQISYSQHPFSGVVEYTIEPLESFNASGITNDKNFDLNQKKELVEIFSKPAYFILEFTTNESLYKSKEQIMDSDSNKRAKLNFLQTFGGGASSVYYSDSNLKRSLAQKLSFGEVFLVTYHFPNWEVTTESKKIGEFVCYKAIKKQKNSNSKATEVVWFTPEIPIQFGPALYNGLPGLVLEVQVGKIRFIASKVKLNTEQIITIEKPTKGTKFTEEEYIKKMDDLANELGF
ncbi:GLPGLI family protein [Flavobacterium sp. SM2513]|uniref:GLPGLI family protein n=1 Tax=Flavobacterium sp. SM2513 TaxID=3424766 RepID=UPI003D7F39D6